MCNKNETWPGWTLLKVASLPDLATLHDTWWSNHGETFDRLIKKYDLENQMNEWRANND